MAMQTNEKLPLKTAWTGLRDCF